MKTAADPQTADEAELCATVAHKSGAVSTLADPRAVRSSQALRDALLRLLERKPLDQITVRDISAEAGVHYSTFFWHHPTKEALLDAVAADQVNHVVTLTVSILENVDGDAATAALLAYVDEHRLLWTTLLTGGAAGTMRQEMLRLSREVASVRAEEKGWIPVDLATACSSSQIFETLAWWVTQDIKRYPIKDVTAIIQRMINFY